VSQHFTDLRLNTHSGGNSEESFWPSFTDIMTVVVMIFLMAMLVLLLNNIDLVKRLQATLAAERAANEQIASTSSQNRDLQARLQALQNELDMLRMQLLNAGEERDSLTTQLAQTRSALEQAQAATQQAQDALVQEQNKNSGLAAQLAELGKLRDQQQSRISSLEAAQQQAADKLAAVQSDFASLKVKYDKLVRPARTSIGKYVVMVRILRQNGVIQRFVQSPEQQQSVAVSEADMYSMLDKLHAAHPDDMYVRIIFPDDSGLSYSEAWAMTETLLKKYDYYYRE
jgi:Tfp pilus assembly protein PilO